MARNTSSQPQVQSRLMAYVRNHFRSFFFSLGKMYRAPVSSFMTMAVIGIALALPCGFYVMLKNLQTVAGGWDNTVQVSLFLKKETSEKSMDRLASRLRQRDDISQVVEIDAAEALADFRQNSGFGKALDTLKENPLPPVLVVFPVHEQREAGRIEALIGELNKLEQVEQAQLDMEWLQRLYAIMDIAQRVLALVAVMLGIAVLLVVGNTIRLDIQNRREEIEVTKLIGATNAFIRRPFLYSGFWYGAIGGLLAWLIVTTGLGLIKGSVERLAGLYQADYQILGLGISGTLLLIMGSILLGLLGSWLAVGRHLGKIEPS